jgi:hypothetical protein
MTQAFLIQRRFRNGQLRCIIERGKQGIPSFFRVSLWMGVGLFQVSFYGAAALLLYLTHRYEAQRSLIHCAGGLGKLMWWADPRLPRLVRLAAYD